MAYCQVAEGAEIRQVSMMDKKLSPCAGHRYPTEIISHAVWLYFRLTLSFRDVEDLLAYRGVILCCEAIRQWTRKLGQDYANTPRRRKPKRGDQWHLDEVVFTLNGKHHSLWGAVDQDGYRLDILVQSRRDRKAAKRFFRKLLKGLCYVPRVLVTDRLKSYGGATSARLCWASNTASTRVSTTGLNCRTNPPGNKSDRCADSTHQPFQGVPTC